MKRSNIKVAAVPFYQGLTLDDFIKVAKRKPELLKYMPDERDWYRADKKWLCDVLYTLDTEEIQTMIDLARQARHEKQEDHEGLIVEMKPEYAEALKSSSSYSCKLHTEALTL